MVIFKSSAGGCVSGRDDGRQRTHGGVVSEEAAQTVDAIILILVIEHKELMHDK